MIGLHPPANIILGIIAAGRYQAYCQHEGAISSIRIWETIMIFHLQQTRSQGLICFGIPDNE